MPDKLQSFKVICSGGLQAGENHLDLSENKPGSATRLVNYEPSLFGGYRRINGYEYLNDLYPVVGGTGAEGKVLCVAIYKDDYADTSYIIAARKDAGASTYSLYRNVPYVGWEKMTLPTGMTLHMSSTARSVTKIRFDTANFGDGNIIFFVDGVNPLYSWDGAEWKQFKSTNAGTNAAPGGDQCLDAPSLVGVFKNTLFVGGDPYNQSALAYSTPGNPVSFLAADGAGQISVGFDLVQFKPFRDSLFVFGGNSIKKVSPDLTSTFVIDSVTANVGCIAPDSVLEIGGDLVFLAPDGIRPVAGTSRIGDVELETISKAIQPLLSYLNIGINLDILNGLVIRSKSQIRYFIGDGSIDAIDSYGIIGALRMTGDTIGWEFGELQGFRASCATSGFIGREEYVLHGDYDGKVYREERGNSLNGEDIVAVYATPYFDFGDTEVRKTMKKCNTFIRPEGPFSMNLSVSYDWDDIYAAKPAAYFQSSDGAPARYRGDVAYGGANVVYGGPGKPIITTDIQGSGYATRLTFVSVGQDDPFSIQGIVFEFGIAGRR